MGNFFTSSFFASVSEWIKYHFYQKKFSTILGLFLLVAWGISIAYFTHEINPHTIVFLLVITGVIILRICLRYPLFGLYFTSVFSSFFALPGRFFSIQSPVGILVEVFTAVLWLAALRKSAQYRTNNYSFWSSQATAMLIILMLYYLLEFFNPAMNNKVGWFFFFRKQISYLLFYFIAFSVLSSYRKVKLFLTFWLALTLVIAIYGIKQQWIGLAAFEKSWLLSDPVLMKLYFQAGFLRKFSFITDPASFGVLCSCFGLFSLVLAVRTQKLKVKYLLYFSVVIFFVATAYSGTRTCIIMIGAGLVSYCIMTINEKKTYLLFSLATLALALLLVMPSGDSPVLNRLQSVLKGSKEASVSVRNTNRHMIQPYIRSHPFGGGINTSGIEGQLYNAGHTLAGFPPDSGYMKILLEQGWIGLAIHLLFYFIILKDGINGFYNARMPAIKNIFIALTVSLFALIVGQYAQISISQYPVILFYYAALAVFIKLNDFESKNQSEVE